MSLRQKIVLLTVIPMLVGMLVLALLINSQTRQLSSELSGVFNNALLDVNQEELRKVTKMARSSLTPLIDNTDLSEREKKEEAKRVISNLAYANDGYFFVYNVDGENIVHPKQPYRIGKNWLALTDSEGKPIIQELISQARLGGGFTEYLWEQPSTGLITRKLGYSELIPEWDWVVGTGVYIDDIDLQLANIDQVFNEQIQSTTLGVLGIALAVVVAVVLCGLALQINELKSADTKLLSLTKRVMNTQDEERRRVSRELHDGISQRLVAVKYSLEEARLAVESSQTQSAQLIRAGEENIDETLSEVRRMARDLHPSILDDLGLMVAIESLVEQFEHRTGIDVTLNRVPFRNLLETAAKTALYRVTQEALSNIERHSLASKVSISFEIQKEWFQLTIADNGKGFEKNALSRKQPADYGLGLRNMAERMGYFKGRFEIESSVSGTIIHAAIPRSSLSLPSMAIHATS